MLEGLLVLGSLIGLVVDAVKIIREGVRLTRRTWQATVRRFRQSPLPEETE